MCPATVSVEAEQPTVYSASMEAFIFKTTHVVSLLPRPDFACAISWFRASCLLTSQVWALGNIAGDSPVCRDLVLQQGAMGPLLQQLTDRSKLSMLRNATWTLSNFCRGKPQPSFEHVRPALPTLAQLIHSVDEEVRVNSSHIFFFLCDLGRNESMA